jgi:hypothetical protein
MEGIPKVLGMLPAADTQVLSGVRTLLMVTAMSIGGGNRLLVPTRGYGHLTHAYIFPMTMLIMRVMVANFDIVICLPKWLIGI